MRSSENLSPTMRGAPQLLNSPMLLASCKNAALHWTSIMLPHYRFQRPFLFSASTCPLPSHYSHHPDVLIIQRLIPAFSNSAPLAKSPLLLPRAQVIWLESIVWPTASVSVSPRSVSPRSITLLLPRSPLSASLVPSVDSLAAASPPSPSRAHSSRSSPAPSPSAVASPVQSPRASPVQTPAQSPRATCAIAFSISACFPCAGSGPISACFRCSISSPITVSFSFSTCFCLPFCFFLWPHSLIPNAHIPVLPLPLLQLPLPQLSPLQRLSLFVHQPQLLLILAGKQLHGKIKRNLQRGAFDGSGTIITGVLMALMRNAKWQRYQFGNLSFEASSDVSPRREPQICRNFLFADRSKPTSRVNVLEFGFARFWS